MQDAGCRGGGGGGGADETVYREWKVQCRGPDVL